MKKSKLREIVRAVIRESLNEDASEEAHRLGLTHAGYGYWKDKSGKTVAKTVDGKLTKVAADEEPKKDANPEDEYDPYANPAPGGLKKPRAQKIEKRVFMAQKKEQAKYPDVKEPPKGDDGKELRCEVDGKPGIIDFFDPNNAQVHVTFDDGTFGMFRNADVKPAK